MENYDWQKNYAIVQRMYYAENIFKFSTMGAMMFTTCNLFYIKKNYFAAAARSRLAPTLKYYALLNLIAIPMLLRPLTRDEIVIQWHKRMIMGKYLYSVFHLDGPEGFVPTDPK